MAPLASLVSLIERYLLHPLRMTVLTKRRAGQLYPEIVGLVALHAIGAAVRRVVGRCELVAAAARSGGVARVHAARMRVVAGGAAGLFMSGGAPADALGMVRVHVGVTALTRELWSSLHIVRRVTARAAIVLGNAPPAEHRLVGVARAAVDRLLGLKGVRPVTT
jgi:hypothetical protein